MQLVAYGAQDIYLTGNPQITFFKVVYRRHTNFSMESIQQTWNGNQGGTSAGRCTATISRNGDLIGKMYLEVNASTIKERVNPLAQCITNVELEIGGQLIDRQSGLFMEVYSELTEPNTGATVLNSSGGTIYGGTLFQRMSGMGGYVTDAAFQDCFYVPLRFWFCRNIGNALPLIALQYHEVKVILDHTFGSGVTTPTQNLYVDYIYLDTDERRRFAQVSHEYLIEQVQTNDLSDNITELTFNHPVKELIWCKPGKIDNNGTVSISKEFKLKLNGHDRFSQRPYTYFTRQQVYDYHTGPGGLSCALKVKGETHKGESALDDSIAVYSFALKPEEHQPSGTCNFSRIDNAQLINGGGHTVFAINYNVLRIMSGMGGLAYSN